MPAKKMINARSLLTVSAQLNFLKQQPDPLSRHSRTIGRPLCGILALRLTNRVDSITVASPRESGDMCG
ncbi:hypothetical protein GCM10010254_04480 [Streptomyces chromofuscus]|nr:hypothetical protein GCM10010254_04480 [Streptomyces chromofuscus]